MFYQNTILYSLTGTEYGPLSSYPEAVYKDSYFLTDLFNRPYEGYNETLTGNGFFKPFNNSLIEDISDINLWIDCTDSSTYRYDRSNSSLISAIIDKSQNNYEFRRYLDTPFLPCKNLFFSRLRDSNMFLTSIAYGGGRFIACSTNTTYFAATTSINEFSIDWNRTGTVTQDQWVDIVYGETTAQGKCFVAVSSASDSFTVSRNGGATWALSSYPISNPGVKSIAYGVDKFVVISNSKSFYWDTNTNNSNFVESNTFPAGDWNRIIFGKDKFLVFGDSDRIAVSNNGINWTVSNSPVSSNFTAGVYGDNGYLIVGGRGTDVLGISSANGTAWTELVGIIPTNGVSARPTSITYSETRKQYFLSFDRGVYDDFSIVYYGINNGIDWSSILLPISYRFNAVASGKSDFNIDLFVGVGNNNLTNVAILSCPYLRSNPISTKMWPATCFDYTNKTGLHFTRDKALFNNDFYINLSDVYTMYMVWKDSNLYSFTIPFGFYSKYNELSGEFIFRKDYDSFVQESLPEGALGIRGTEIGHRIETFFDLLCTNNITLWEKTTAEFLSGGSNLYINNSSIDLTSAYPIPIDTVLGGSKIGYLSGSNDNNFVLCEILMFNKLLNKEEKGLVGNYISNKYCFPYYFENLVYTVELTGGPMSNYSYEDFSILTSIITLPIQSCITLLTISLSSFETTKSNISKVVYSCGDLYGSLDGAFNTDLSGRTSVSFNKNSTLQFYVVPSNTQTIQSYFVYLSVFRNDTSINKIILSGSLLKCGVLDLYSKNKFVDSQILDDSKELLLVTENLNRNMLYLNKISVDIPTPSLTGGEVEPLVNIDFGDTEEDILLLSELLEDRVEEKFRRPFFVPVPAPRTNPIRPE